MTKARWNRDGELYICIHIYVYIFKYKSTFNNYL